MRLLISHKLFIALLTATAVVVVVALVLTRWSFNRGFLDYVNAVEAERIATVTTSLQSIYAETDNWDSLLENPLRWRTVMDAYSGRPAPRQFDAPPMPPGADEFHKMSERQGPGMDGPPSHGRPDRGKGPRKFDGSRRPPPGGPGGFRQPLDLLDAQKQTLIGRPGDHPDAQLAAIEHNGEVIGYVRYLPITALTDLNNAAEQQFITQQRSALLLTAVIALLAAALLAYLFGRRLIAPIRTLVSGTEELAGGQLLKPIAISSHDELGQLAESFNTMAASLAHAKQTQQQWLADIAHELRTPLAILMGELQAIEDGVREWTPATCASLQTEVDRLSSLVNDLREVSLADAGGLDYQRREIDLRDVVENALSSYAHRIDASGLTVETFLPATEVLLIADARRLEQVIINLLENSCRYTDAGGQIHITCTQTDTIELLIEDTAPGAPADALPRLFDRLYRAESSRNRGHGGSGLGLAICKGIITAHGGAITAAPAALGGLAIRVELPHDHA